MDPAVGGVFLAHRYGNWNVFSQPCSVAPPRPKPHSFSINITTTISPVKGSIILVLYVPRGYQRPLRAHPGSNAPQCAAYPIVVIFHGGGFPIGGPYDNARWASAILENVNAVVVSVGYRLAPEHPFSNGCGGWC